MANNGEKKSNFSKAATWVKNNKLEAVGYAAMAVPVVGVAGWAARGVYTAGKFAWKARKIHAASAKAKALKAGKAIGKYTQPGYRKAADFIGPKHRQAKKTWTSRAHAESARTKGKQASWRHKTVRLKDKKAATKFGKPTKQYAIRPSFAGVATSKAAIGAYGAGAVIKAQSKKAKAQAGTQTGNGTKTPKKKNGSQKKNGGYKSVESAQGKKHTPGSIHGSRQGPSTYNRSRSEVQSRFQKIVNESKRRLYK